MELEDANLTLSGSVQTINDTEELMKEMTPWRKKIRIIVEDEDGVCEEVSYRIVSFIAGVKIRWNITNGTIKILST